TASLLDTYQPERERQVRAIVETAIAMGRVVCTLDPAAAAARDADMLARRAAGLPGPALTFPPITEGVVLTGTPGAGGLFPQPWNGDDAAPVRFDDVAGDGFWLIAEDARGPEVAGLRRVSLTDPVFGAFAAPLRDWLGSRGVEAVLVRPDRYVFGSGNAVDLVEKLANLLR
ncbi:MAG: hypothetical protein JNL07_00390, partial [Rhodospirillales bacterium]|nr:hypothetical protein [Rhodospirillales bacterium]